MATPLTLRATKGSPLTHNEMDANLTALQTTADDALAATATLTADKAEATALGVANTDQNMGSFTGTTIPDNVSAKAGMQALETAVEAAPSSATLAASSGSSLVGYINSPTGSVARTVQGRLREKVSLLDFGALNDGLQASAATNSAALMAFNTWAVAESAAGRRVDLIIPPGVYYWNSDTGSASCFLHGIKNLSISGYGASTINMGASFPQAWPQSCNPLFYQNSTNPKIATAPKSQEYVTALTPSELSIYSVGEYVMISCLDIQYNGYPPNFWCFDFVKISAIDTGTGRLDFAGYPLSYEYRSDYPDYAGGSNVDLQPSGAARIVKLERTNAVGVVGSWDVDHYFEGFHASNLNDNNPDYVTPTGRRVVFKDVVVPGFAESICGYFLADNCIERLHSEPDKLVEISIRRGGESRAPLGVYYQSGSVDVARLEGYKARALATGAKTLLVSDCDIGSLGYGGNLGFNVDTLVQNSRVRTISNTLAPYTSGIRLNYVDGTNITYANGVFTVLKNTLTGLANGGGVSNWNVIPGQLLNLCVGTPGDLTSAGSVLSSDIGTGIVLSLTESGGGASFDIETTLPYATMPAWASGQVFIKRRNDPRIIGCSGHGQVASAGEAARVGKDLSSYHKMEFAAQRDQSISISGRVGKLKRFYCNVYKAMTGTTFAGGAKVEFKDLASLVASTMATPVTYQINIDLTVAGVRDYDYTALTGATANDTVTVNAVAQTTLDADRWCTTGMPSIFYGFVGTSKTLTDLPMFEVIMEFDVGLFARRLTYKSSSVSSGYLVGMTGDIA